MPASGTYRWHVNPSSRPLVSGETWKMTCTAGASTGSRQLAIDRGQQVTVNWGAGCTP